MKIHKWVPVISEERSKISRAHAILNGSNKENNPISKDNSILGEDSNTAFSTVSEGQSQGVTDFSSAQFNMSEDSNSEFKKLECANNVKNVSGSQ